MRPASCGELACGLCDSEKRLRLCFFAASGPEHALVDREHFGVELAKTALCFAACLEALDKTAIPKILDGRLPSLHGRRRTRHHKRADAPGHLRWCSFFRLHFDLADDVLHEFADAAVNGALLCHHDGRLHERQHAFRRLHGVLLADQLCEFRVPRFEGLVVAAQCVDQALRVGGRVDAAHGLGEVVEADLLHSFRGGGLRLGDCGFGGSHLRRHGGSHLRFRLNRTARLTEERTLVDVHQKSPAFCAPAAADKPLIPSPMAVWNGDTDGAVDAVMTDDAVGMPE